MAIENEGKKGWDFKEKLVDLLDEIIETVKDATGLNWILDDGLNKIWNVIAVLILCYIRWWIKLAIFIGIIYLIVALMFPHSGTKF